MAPFAFAPFILAIETMVQQLPTMAAFQGDVKIGVPEAAEARYFAAITGGPATPTDGTMGGQQRYVRAFILLGYRVGGDERAAELAILQLVDEITAAVLANPTMSGTSDDAVTVDTEGADRPIYEGRAGAELRIYPVMLIGHQQQEDVV